MRSTLRAHCRRTTCTRTLSTPRGFGSPFTERRSHFTTLSLNTRHCNHGILLQNEHRFHIYEGKENVVAPTTLHPQLNGHEARVNTARERERRGRAAAPVGAPLAVDARRYQWTRRRRLRARRSFKTRDLMVSTVRPARFRARPRARGNGAARVATLEGGARKPPPADRQCARRATLRRRVGARGRGGSPPPRALAGRTVTSPKPDIGCGAFSARHELFARADSWTAFVRYTPATVLVMPQLAQYAFL
ncbi:hypothetical protein EVAR_53382_1 [Eumeta japonica]|uniref:Uncharacterized protein n=1 Tax=Eumeta variegata TaxID=151549 RepID=A0A4C1Y8C8_EUMVA|nr:hypothetical protein EVAR_53382_1 [Eumeta japonica]